jgi:hypothetical protein
VPHDLQNVDLSGDSLHVALVLDLVFLQDFDGDLLARDEVGAQSDFTERSLPE